MNQIQSFFQLKPYGKRIGFSEVCEDFDTKTKIKNQDTHSDTQWGQVWDVITQYSGRAGRDDEGKWWWHKGKGQLQVTSLLFLLSFKETASTNGLEELQHHHRVYPHWTVRRPPHPGSALCALPGDLSPDRDGEPDDAAGDQGWLPSPHAHVLLLE